MTVNADSNTSGPYTGNGVADEFSYTFKVQNKTDLTVYETDTDGVQTTLTVDTDYTVNNVGDSSGTITRAAGPLPTDYQWFIESNYQPEQLTEFASQGAFFPSLHEEAMDKLTFLVQQSLRSLSRAMLLPPGYGSGLNLTLPTPVAGRFVRWNGAATGFENVDLSEIDPDVIALADLNSNVSSYAQMQALTASFPYAIAMVAAEGSGGPFWYDPADTTTPATTGITIIDSVGRRRKRIYNDIVHSAWFMEGAAPLDDVTDEFEEWLSFCADNGLTPFLSSRIHRLTREVTWPARMIHMKGAGRGMTYPGPNAHLLIKQGVIYADHTDRNAIRFIDTAEQSTSSSLEGVNIVGRDGAAGPTAAIGFDCGGVAALFQRDQTFRDCGIYNFTSAFDVYDSGGSDLLQWGVLKMFNCAINRNKHIMRTLNGCQVNGLVFQHNEAGQNGTAVGEGGINVAAHAVSIMDNLLEGQRDPIKLAGAFRACVIKNNYFEACSGRACIDVNGVIGPLDIGPNLFIDATTDVNVILGNSGSGLCTDPYWWEGTTKLPFPELGNGTDGERILPELDTNPTTGYGLYRIDDPTDSSFTNEPDYLTGPVNQAITIGAREINPMSGRPMPAEVYTTSGSGSITATYTISGSAGEYVAMTWLMKQVPDGTGTTNPYVSFAVNGTSGNGGRDYDFSQAANFCRQGDWMIITAAIKLTGAMTSLTLSLFPFGVSPAAGRVARFVRPTVYTANSVNKLRPFIDSDYYESVTAAPTAGTWKTGDALKNRSPAAGQGTFVCSAGGTPGTWVYG